MLKSRSTLVTSAKAISGDPTLQPSAEAAAKSSKFEMPKLSLEIVTVTGILTYDFSAAKKVGGGVYLRSLRVEARPNKYQSSIKALVDRLKYGKPAGEKENAFVRGGKADVIVRLTELKPETVDSLKKLGLEVLAELSSANAVVGRIPIEKIAELAELDVVTFISPQER